MNSHKLELLVFYIHHLHPSFYLVNRYFLISNWIGEKQFDVMGDNIATGLESDSSAYLKDIDYYNNKYLSFNTVE